MTKHQEAGGKGLTRVEIAERAVAKAKGNLDAAQERLARAVQEEEGRAEKKKERARKAKDRAVAVLVKAGMSREKALKTLG